MKKSHHKLKFFTCLASTVFVSVLLLSQISTVQAGYNFAIGAKLAEANEGGARAEAQRLSNEGWKLYKQGTAESQRQAIGKFLEALKLWQEVNDKRLEATTLSNIGLVYDNLGENQEALKYYNQALPIHRAVNDRLGEATTLSSIGIIYLGLGKNQEALKYYNQALLISRAVGDRQEETDSLNKIGLVYFLLGEKQEALKYYNQALSIIRAAGDRLGQAPTLSNIGTVYLELGEKQEALKYYNQALPLYRAVNDRREEASTLKNIGLVYSHLKDNKQALDFYNQALAILKANNYLPEQADTLASIALNYQRLGETEKALDYYQQALKIYRQTKNLPKQTKTLASIGLLYASKGDRPSAEKYIQQVLELQKTIPSQLQQNWKTQIDTLLILGQIAISYLALGDTQQRIFYLNQGQIIAHEVGRTKDEAKLISEIGVAYYNLGETQKAKDNFAQALKLQREIKDYEGEARTLVNIAFIDTKSGEFQQALDQLNQALSISKQKQNLSLEGEILSQMSDVYRELGAYELSIETNKKVLVIYQKSSPYLVGITLGSIGTSYLASCFYQKKSEDCDQTLYYLNQALTYAHEKAYVFQEISILVNIAAAYYVLKKYPQAIINGKQALELSRKYNFEALENASLISLSGLYEGAGDYQNALDASKQSLLLSQKLRDLPSLATAYRNQGKIYASMKQPQQAIEAYNQQLKLAKLIGDTSNQTYSLYKIAIIERDRKNFNQAKTNIETVINIIEQKRSKITSQDLRSSYFATVQDYYEFYVDLLMQLHREYPSKGYDAEALNASERSRARGLIELLAEAGANIRKGVDPKLLASEQLLLDKIDATQKQIQELAAKPNTEARIEALKKESENFLTQYRSLQTQIRTSSPEYAALKYPEPLELKQIQQQLDPDTVLLQYSLGKDRSYLWAVTPDSLQAYELPGQKQIEDAANNFRDVMLSGGTPFGKDNPDAINKPASQLSQIILAPVADKLGKKRLVIVAGGVLQNIPFAALADPEAKERNKSLDPYQPLIVNHEIVNLPSVTALATHRQQLKNRQPALKTLAVLADPVFEASDERVTGKKPAFAEFDPNRSTLQRAIKNLKRTGLSRLEGTRTEASSILKLVSPSQSLHAYDFDANYNFANSKELKQYRFLLFATHGIVDTTSPELSGIALSQIDKEGKQVKNGYLRLGDIFNLDLGAELVVLSACETGLGKDVKGEGLMGLTRGLMYAGSKRAVVSLWQVDDKGTSQLMPKFYSSVLQGKSPTTALRDAQLQLWHEKTFQNPYYWAAFTLQGEWR